MAKQLSETEQSALLLKDTPEGWAARWAIELKAADEWVRPWHEQAKASVKRYLDERDAAKNKGAARWNLYQANVETAQALMFGRTPQVTVTREFADAQDDLARIGAELLERALNAGIVRFGDSYSPTLALCLQDRLLAGLGVQWWTKEEEEADTPPKAPIIKDGKEVAPAVPSVPKVVKRRAVVEWVFWGDFLWSPARVWSEVRWVARKSNMSRKRLVERFGKELGDVVPLNAQPEEKQGEDKEPKTPWRQAEVWEIWEKESRRVYWYVKGMRTTLDMKEDPLKLDGFFPCQEPFFANTTTSKLLPKPDYEMARDLYEEVDRLCTRIARIQRAVKVAGIYDKTATAVSRLLQEATDNELLPADAMAVIAEKGGIKGCVDWLPIDQFVAALTVLGQQRLETKEQIWELTGMSDLMRGQADPQATATQDKLKAKFGGARLGRIQDAFAKFASDGQRLRAEIILRHFDTEEILRLSQAGTTYDAAQARQAVEYLKTELGGYSVTVKPENIAAQDFAALKSERVEVVASLGELLTSTATLIQASPAVLPMVLESCRWVVAATKGAGEIEAVIDRAIQAAQQAAAQGGQQQPNPDALKLQTAQMKGEYDLKKEAAKAQARQQEIAAEVDADRQREAMQAQYGVQEALGKAVIDRALKPQPVVKPGQGGGNGP